MEEREVIPLGLAQAPISLREFQLSEAAQEEKCALATAPSPTHPLTPLSFLMSHRLAPKS